MHFSPLVLCSLSRSSVTKAVRQTTPPCAAMHGAAHLHGYHSIHGLHRAVAYVKYERASCAAAAMEALHETVLADGRTRLKVLLAEAPTARRDARVTIGACT